MLTFVKTTELVRGMYEPSPVIVLMGLLVLSVKKEVVVSLEYCINLTLVNELKDYTVEQMF